MNYEQYRQQAAICLRLAGETDDPKTKGTLIDMAQTWQRLAEQADKNRRTDLVYERPPPTG